MARISCPICNRKFDPETSRAMPFCSERCRQIDLGHWLGEQYSVPVERDADAESDTGWNEEEFS